MNTVKQIALVSAALCASMLLAACGGGGGSSGGGVSETPSNSDFDSASGQSLAATSAPRSAATNTPNQGSVTQSSNGDGVTTDTITVVADLVNGVYTYTISNGDKWSVTDADEISTGEYSALFIKETDDGYLAMYGVGTDYDAIDGSGDTDWLALGAWFYVPEDAQAVDKIEIGAFADGSAPFTQANIAGLASTANYSGVAFGLFTAKTADASDAGSFTGDVALAANFDTDTISGNVNNIEAHSVADEADYSYTGSISLQSASIDATKAGGFFTGDTSGTLTGSFFGEQTSRTFDGKWGGQFYDDGAADDDYPATVLGTLGGAYQSADGNDEINFVGAFATELDE